MCLCVCVCVCMCVLVKGEILYIKVVFLKTTTLCRGYYFDDVLCPVEERERERERERMCVLETGLKRANCTHRYSSLQRLEEPILQKEELASSPLRTGLSSKLLLFLHVSKTGDSLSRLEQPDHVTTPSRTSG